MNGKAKSVLGLLVICCLLLVGCGKSSSTHHSTQSSEKTSTTKKVSSKKSSQLWNKSKDQQLDDFINKWAPTMGQSYTKYDGQNDLKTKTGMHYPSDLKDTTVNGSNASIGWAPSGKGKYDYNVVALYNYNRPSVGEGHITYAFAFHDGQPVALVDQSTNGVPNWTPTKNTDVESNFERIAQGQKSNFGGAASTANNSNANSSHSINNVQEAMAAVKAKYDPNGNINWSYMKTDGSSSDMMEDDDGNECYWIRGQEKDFHTNGAGSYDGHDYYVYPDGTIKPR